MTKVGITGGIGSGKSMICEIFAKLGVPVYSADIRAKALINNEPAIKEQLISRFGNAIYKNNQLDRALLAGIIFDDVTAIEFVNSMVHPAVANDFKIWSMSYASEPYVVEEAALLFESGSYRMMDKMVTIYSPADLRIKRAVLRDQVTVSQVHSRMKNQLPDEEKMARSDYVIYNDEIHSVLEQVLNLHHIFLSHK